MTRRKKIDRPTPLTIQMPESLHRRVHEELFSELEGRVPYGAVTALGSQLFSEWVRNRHE